MRPLWFFAFLRGLSLTRLSLFFRTSFFFSFFSIHSCVFVRASAFILLKRYESRCICFHSFICGCYFNVLWCFAIVFWCAFVFDGLFGHIRIAFGPRCQNNSRFLFFCSSRLLLFLFRYGEAIHVCEVYLQHMCGWILKMFIHLFWFK